MLLTRMWSEPGTFKEVKFTPGLNVVLAHVSDQSTNNHPRSRNGAGKTTFAQMMKFCLLAPLEPDSFLRGHDFRSVTLFLEFKALDGTKFVLARSMQSPNVARLYRNEQLELTSSIVDMRQHLAFQFAGLEPNDLSLHHLLGYLVRDEIDGYADVFKPFAHLGTPLWIASNLFLMGLPHEYPFAISELGKQQDEIYSIRRGLTSHLESKGMAEPLFLQLELQAAKEQLQTKEMRLSSFSLSDEYKVQMQTASDIHRQLRRLRSQNFLDSQRLQDYRELLDTMENGDASIVAVTELYGEMGVVVPDSLQKSLDEVLEFQARLVQTRRKFLQSEMAALELMISERNREITELDRQRSLIMATLNTSDPLEEFHAQSQVLSQFRDRVAQLEALNEIHAEVYHRDQQASEINERIHTVAEKWKASLAEEKARIGSISAMFARMYRRLYGHAASLEIKLRDSAIVFALKGPGKEFRSSGKYRAAIFCYDMALLAQNRSRNPFFHWLLHDGVFTGVDSEQVDEALRIASELPNDLQYICTLNSDKVPHLLDFLRPFTCCEISDFPPEKRFMQRRF